MKSQQFIQLDTKSILKFYVAIFLICMSSWSISANQTNEANANIQQSMVFNTTPNQVSTIYIGNRDNTQCEGYGGLRICKRIPYSNYTFNQYNTQLNYLTNYNDYSTYNNINQYGSHLGDSIGSYLGYSQANNSALTYLYQLINQLIAIINQIFNQSLCSQHNLCNPNPTVCTQEQRLCADGSAMPRDPDCTWRPERCPIAPQECQVQCPGCTTIVTGTFVNNVCIPLPGACDGFTPTTPVTPTTPTTPVTPTVKFHQVMESKDSRN
jgi:hypothetical protein